MTPHPCLSAAGKACRSGEAVGQERISSVEIDKHGSVASRFVRFTPQTSVHRQMNRLIHKCNWQKYMINAAGTHVSCGFTLIDAENPQDVAAQNVVELRLSIHAFSVGGKASSVDSLNPNTAGDDLVNSRASRKSSKPATSVMQYNHKFIIQDSFLSCALHLPA